MLLFSFFSFSLYRKSQAGRGQTGSQPLAQASPTASHSRQPGKARMSCLFVRASSPHPCSTDLFLSDGTGARSGAVATVVQALQSLCRGGHWLPAPSSIGFRPANSCVLRSVLTQLSWPRARCRARRYSKRLLLLLGWPSVSAQSRASRCLVHRQASQTWRASELSPVAQLGQPSAVGMAVPPKMSLYNAKAQASSAQCPQKAAHLLHGVPKKQYGNEKPSFFSSSPVPSSQTPFASGSWRGFGCSSTAPEQLSG